VCVGVCVGCVCVCVCGWVCASGNADRAATVSMTVRRAEISTAKMCAKDRTACRGSAMIPGSHDTQHSTAQRADSKAVRKLLKTGSNYNRVISRTRNVRAGKQPFLHFCCSLLCFLICSLSPPSAFCRPSRQSRRC
jgi:hypothetical protein